MMELMPANMEHGDEAGSSPAQSGAGALVLALIGAGTISAAFALMVPELRHWMILPVTACGVLVGMDAVAWILGKTDVLEPRALVGLFGTHFFFLAPLLHVAWQHWPSYVAPASDWRASLGFLGLVNMFGLIIYRAGMSVPLRARALPQMEVDEKRFQSWAWHGIFLGFLAFGYVVMSFGGPEGYLSTVSSGRDALAGTGWLLLVGEAWPLLLFAAILLKRREWLRDHRLALILLLVAFVVAQFVTGGLRGSRSNTIWPTLIAVGMVHLMVLQVRRRALIAGALVLTGFMYLYGFYKTAGTEALDIVGGTVSADQMVDRTGRSLPLLLLEDFGRAGTQALVVDRQMRDEPDKLGMGLGYVGDLAKLMPSIIVPDPPPDKVVLGTETLYGSGATESGMRSSRIFGLVGEAMLNFGALGGALAFIPFTIFVRFAGRTYAAARASTSVAARMLAPALGIAAVLALGSDLDNLVWFLMKQALPLAAVIWLAGRKADQPL